MGIIYTLYNFFFWKLTTESAEPHQTTKPKKTLLWCLQLLWKIASAASRNSWWVSDFQIIWRKQKHHHLQLPNSYSNTVGGRNPVPLPFWQLIPHKQTFKQKVTNKSRWLLFDKFLNHVKMDPWRSHPLMLFYDVLNLVTTSIHCHSVNMSDLTYIHSSWGHFLMPPSLKLTVGP